MCTYSWPRAIPTDGGLLIADCMEACCWLCSGLCAGAGSRYGFSPFWGDVSSGDSGAGFWLWYGPSWDVIGMSSEDFGDSESNSLRALCTSSSCCSGSGSGAGSCAWVCSISGLGSLVVRFGKLFHRHCDSGGVGGEAADVTSEEGTEEGTGSDPDLDILQMP